MTSALCNVIVCLMQYWWPVRAWSGVARPSVGSFFRASRWLHKKVIGSPTVLQCEYWPKRYRGDSSFLGSLHLFRCTTMHSAPEIVRNNQKYHYYRWANDRTTYFRSDTYSTRNCMLILHKIILQMNEWFFCLSLISTKTSCDADGPKTYSNLNQWDFSRGMHELEVDHGPKTYNLKFTHPFVKF